MRDGTVLRLVGLALLAAVAVTLWYQGPVLLGQTTPVLPRVVLILKMDYERSTFWRAVRDGALLAAEDYRVELSVRAAKTETEIDEQIRLLNQAIDEKPQAILLAAADFERLVPGVRRARNQGIPVLTVDSFIRSDDALSRIGTDNVEAGRKAALALLKHTVPGAQVAVFSYIKGSSTAMDRERGLRETLSGRVDLLPTLFSNAEADLAYQQAKTMLAQYPSLGGLVALNEPTTLGVARALAESGQASRIPLVGVDNTFAMMKYLERGVLRDTIVQQPLNMGYLGVAAARRVIDQQPVEPVIDTGSVDIDKTTMFLQQNQKLLFPVNDTLR